MAVDSEKEIERIRHGYDAFNRGDFDAAAELIHPDIVWNRAAADFEGPAHGAEAVRGLWEPEVFTTQFNEVHSIEPVADCVLVEATFHGEGAGSGIKLDQRGFHLWRIRGGKAIEFRYFLDRDEAMHAAKG
jgi:ketosteroid isomerase-like protein